MPKIRTPLLLFLVLIFGFGFQTSALAACANPAGSEGDMMYNSTSHTMQFCNNANNWIQMGPSSSGAADYTTNLIHHWTFDSTINDSDCGGSCVNGTLTNGATYSGTAMVGTGSLSLDGNNDRVDLAANLNANATQRTITAWVKGTDYDGSSGANFNQNIYSEPSTSNCGSAELTLNTYEGNNADPNENVTLTANFGTTMASGYPVLTDGTWYFFTGVFDSVSDTHTVYINGAVSDSESVAASAIPATTYMAAIGANAHGTCTNYNFKGLIDDVRIYSTALTSGQVAQIYNATVGCTNPTGSEGDLMYNSTYAVPQFCNGATWIGMGPLNAAAATAADYTTNIVSWWKMDDGAGNTAVDDGSNGDDAALQNTPTWVAGKINGGLSFSGGSSEYGNVGNKANLYFSGSFSIAAWVKPSSVTTAGQAILSDYNAGGTTASFTLWLNNGLCTAGGKMFCFYWENPNGTVPHVESTTVASNGTWYHVAATVSSSGGNNYTRKIYVNGALEDTDSTAQARADNGTNTSISRAGSFAGDYYSGVIDDLRVYNAALTLAQVQQIQLSVPVFCANPVGNQGDIMYNTTSHVMQYCAGTSWTKMGGP